MEITIQELRDKYTVLQKKYNLPKFDEVNEHFYLDTRIIVDSEYFLREISNAIRRKIADALGYVEGFLNPQNLPRFYFSYIKSMGEKDRKAIDDSYYILSLAFSKAIVTDVEYDEKKDAEMVKVMIDAWNKSKRNIEMIMKNVSESLEKSSTDEVKGTSRNYLG